MRKILALVIAYLAIAGTAQGQTATPTPYVFTHGVYQFEDVTSNMVYTGSWASECSNAFCYRRGDNGATVSFYAKGVSVIIYREAVNAYYGIVQICVNSVCGNYPNNDGNSLPLVIVLPDTTSNWQVALTVTYYYRFDSFMVLGTAGSAIPTPTAITFPPSPTPISTWTPGPSVTPQPTATPLGLIWAIDPACQYGTTETGQITCTNHSATAGDVAQFMVLTVLTLSGLGMFFLFMFGFVEGRRK